MTEVERCAMDRVQLATGVVVAQSSCHSEKIKQKTQETLWAKYGCKNFRGEGFPNLAIVFVMTFWLG
jgi:hypothetical protein